MHFGWVAEGLGSAEPVGLNIQIRSPSHLVHRPTSCTPPKPYQKILKYIFLERLYLNNYNSYLYKILNIAY